MDWVHLDIKKNLHKEIKAIAKERFKSMQDFLAYCIFEIKYQKGLSKYQIYTYNKEVLELKDKVKRLRQKNINASVQELKKTYDTGFKDGYEKGLKVDKTLKQLSKI